MNIKSITILGGMDKNGISENQTLIIKKGEIVCLVGPTGSGKSQLLSDIECLANGDTPSKRKVLIEQESTAKHMQTFFQNKIVAQLSQNMNFVMDISVREFVLIHAKVKKENENIEISELANEVILQANELAGEKFSPDNSLTQLSGGQSRALMIADTALLSPAPIVLIDEIENAGVDRRKALDLLIKKDKIVFISTHDPVLALIGNKRLVMENGMIKFILETQEMERYNLSDLEFMDAKMIKLRNLIRAGKRIDFSIKSYLSWENEG